MFARQRKSQPRHGLALSKSGREGICYTFCDVQIITDFDEPSLLTIPA
jgi:hypothetical protein